MDDIDSWTRDVDGIRYRVRIVPDVGASPRDYEDYTPRQVKAREEGEWQFLTGQACDPAACVRGDVVPELADELWPQPDAAARLTELRDALSALLASLHGPRAVTSSEAGR